MSVINISAAVKSLTSVAYKLSIAAVHYFAIGFLFFGT